MAILKNVFLLSCLIALAASAAVESPLSVKFVTEDQLEDFLVEHPDAVKLEGKNANETTRSVGEERLLISYTLGNRQNGDYLVAHSVSDQISSWTTPQDAYVSGSYPASGIGHVVTYVDILIAQSSVSGAAYVTGGGIGQRQISLYVSAYQTYYFGWDIKIFGRN